VHRWLQLSAGTVALRRCPEALVRGVSTHFTYARAAINGTGVGDAGTIFLAVILPARHQNCPSICLVDECGKQVLPALLCQRSTAISVAGFYKPVIVQNVGRGRSDVIAAGNLQDGFIHDRPFRLRAEISVAVNALDLIRFYDLACAQVHRPALLFTR
jgi:hypothetical protein